MQRSKYNGEGTSSNIVINRAQKIYTKPGDIRVLVFEHSDGTKVELFKSTLIIQRRNARDIQDDHRIPNIKLQEVLTFLGHKNHLDAPEFKEVFSITGSEAAMDAMKTKITDMACGNSGSIAYRNTYAALADLTSSTRIDVAPGEFTLPTDTSKILLFKNGSIMTSGYTVSANGFDLTVAAVDSTDTFELIVLN